MIYFTLPNFINNVNVNILFLDFYKMHSEILLSDDIVLGQVSGNFPFCCWNGGYNTNRGDTYTYDQFNDLRRIMPLPVRFNCANIGLEETDFVDPMGNTILDIFNTGSNYIEVSNLFFYEYLAEKYPQYKFIFSKQGDLVTEFTPEIINAILSFDKFDLLGLPDRFNNDIDFLKQINLRRKLEITVNPRCPVTCRYRRECYIQEHTNQLLYSENSVIDNCKKAYDLQNGNNKNLKTIEDLKEIYLPLGINHFTFSQIFTDPDTVFTFYMKYFIKPEQYEYARTRWEQIKREVGQGKNG